MLLLYKGKCKKLFLLLLCLNKIKKKYQVFLIFRLCKFPPEI